MFREIYTLNNISSMPKFGSRRSPRFNTHAVPVHETHHIMMTSSIGNIFRLTGPLCGEFIGNRWIPRSKASDAKLWCFLFLRPNKRLNKQSWGWRFETPSRSSWRHCNGNSRSAERPNLLSLLSLLLAVKLWDKHDIVTAINSGGQEKTAMQLGFEQSTNFQHETITAIYSWNTIGIIKNAPYRWW